MKKNLFKTPGLVLVVVLALSLALSGCGSSTTQPAQSTQAASGSSTAQATTAAPAELAFVNLTYYTGQPIDNMSNEATVMEEVNKVLKEKINANLKFNFIANAQYAQKLNVMMASGDEFDLASIGGFITNFTSVVSKDAFIPVDDLLQKYGQTILSQVDSRYWAAVTYNGKKMGIIDLMVYALPRGLGFKKDLIDKYKFDYTKVQELKDFEPYLDTIKRNEKDIIPFSAFYSGQGNPGFPGMKYDAYDQIVSSIVFDMADGKVKNLFDVQYIQESLKILSDWYKKGYIAKDASLKKDNIAEVKTQKYAVTIDGGASDETNQKAASLYGFPIVEKTTSTSIIGTAGIQGTVTGISRTSKNPERAMMLKDLMASDKKLFNTMCYGLEDQDYTVVSGAGSDNPTVQSNKDMKWAIWHPWIGNLFLGWPSNWNSQAAIDGFAKANQTAKTSPILGFVFNPDPVKAEIAKLDSILQPAYAILYTGSEPDYGKYVTDLNTKLASAGLQKVIDEVNNQLNSWRTANGK